MTTPNHELRVCDLIKTLIKLKPDALVVLSSDREGNEHSFLEGYEVVGRRVILIPKHERVCL